MTLSLLASCNKGGGDTPDPPAPTEYTLTLTLNDCNVGGESTYSKKYNKGTTIDSITVSPNDSFVLTADSIDTTYKQYWNASTDENYTLSNLVMNSNHRITITATTPTPTKKWYEHEDWWNYCSNGVDGVQAMIADIGQEVNVTVYNKVHKVRLIDVDHLEPKETVAQAHCTFEFANVITDYNGAVTTYWNNSDEDDSTNNYFPLSTLNGLLNNGRNCIFNKLPNELQSAIKEVYKKVGIGSSYSTDEPYPTKLFLLAHDEMIDHEHLVPPNEGTKYQYYKTHTDPTDRIKRVVGSSSVVGEYYWLRSPYTGSDEFAWYVDIDGDLINSNGYIYSKMFAIAPAFCI